MFVRRTIRRRLKPAVDYSSTDYKSHGQPDILARQMTTLRKVPTFGEMMWPTLLALKQMGGSPSNQELLTCVMKLIISRARSASHTGF
jgi:hypothetical protein